MKTLSRNAIIGYPAGIITGITYGLNPLFAVPLMKQGASVDSILFFRYLFAVILLGAWLMIRKHSFSISLKRVGILAVLGMLFTSSSLFLFASYNYIASGLATTIVFLYTVIVAIIMVFLRVIPSWQVWLAIVATFCRRHYHDPKQLLTGNQLTGHIAITRLCYRLLAIYRDNQSKHHNCRHFQFIAHILFPLSGRGSVLCAQHHCRNGINARYILRHRLDESCVARIAPHHCLHCHIGNCHSQHWCYQSLCDGRIRAGKAILVGTVVFDEPLTTNIVIGIALSIAAIIFMIQTTKR